jgi:hypothetical protein
MTKFKITYRPNGAMNVGRTESIEAEYFRLNEGWFEFKDAEHKQVLTVFEHSVESVARES